MFLSSTSSGEFAILEKVAPAFTPNCENSDIVNSIKLDTKSNFFIAWFFQ
jgi:hypothetical protein